MTNYSSIYKLEKKLNSLEEKIKKLETKSISSLDNLGFNVYNKNLLNKNIISAKTFILKTITNNPKHTLFFQAKIKLLNYSTQDIQLKLLADDIQIEEETIKHNSGIVETTIFGTYQNLISDTIKIKLFVNPKSKKQITLLNTTLTVWGISETFAEEYDATENNSKYFLSYISNDRLYYKYFLKTKNVDEVDFDFFEESSSHSTCCFSDNIFLFRVDPNNNLFFCNVDNFEEKFIKNNVTKVSACASNDSIVFCFISDESCYYGEIKNNAIISINKINSPVGKYINCYTYCKYDKCYVIVTKDNGGNYLLESLTPSYSSNENISAQVSISITQEEVE